MWGSEINGFRIVLQPEFNDSENEDTVRKIISTHYNSEANFDVYTGMTLKFTLMKRKILLVVGIVVAIVIGLSTGLFGMA